MHITADSLRTLRVDSVGSFLRPQTLKEAFKKHAAGDLDDASLKAAQDEAIRGVVADQERHGMPFVNDGEYRRRSFNMSFAVVEGMEPWYARVSTTRTVQHTVEAAGLKREVGNEFRVPIAGKLRLKHNALLDEFGFVKSVAHTPASVTLLSLDRIFQRYAPEESGGIYPTISAFLGDAAAVQQQMVRELGAAGCEYVHIDAPSYTSYVDAEMLAGMRSRNEDPAENLTRSIAADNTVVAALPEATFGIHLCRGNGSAMWHRSGTYDAIAEQLFNGLAHQRFLLEYDDERSGSFAPLRFVPKGKMVVLGLISTKRARLESVDELRGRIEEAAKYVPLEQLALSPQCGFSSGLEGNPLTFDEQWAKIDRMLEVARLVWG